MNPKISVLLTTVRYGGLDWQLKLLAKQTFKNFELIVIDGCHVERKDKIKNLAETFKLNLIYIEEKFPFKTTDIGALAYNLIICKAKGECIVFIDDYETFPKNYLEEQYRMYELGYAGMCRWDQIKYVGNIDYSEAELELKSEDIRYKQCIEHYPDMGYPRSETAIHGIHMNNIPWDWWWPSSSSVPAKYLHAVNGFNELYCGISKNVDCDIAYRMHKLGLKFAYNPNIIMYHIYHGHLPSPLVPMRKIPGRDGKSKCEYKHDLHPFTKNEYWSHGNPNLIENDQLFTWHQDGYKLYQCKHCGEVGCVDGQQMLQNTKERCEQNIYIPPEKIVFPNGTIYNCTKLKKNIS